MDKKKLPAKKEVGGAGAGSSKKAEEALKDSEVLLQATGEMAKVGGWELDLSTNQVSWTEEVCRIHGVEQGYKTKLEEALNFYAPESRPALEEVLKKATETGEPYDIEALFIPSGSKDKIWIRSIGKAIYSGGKVVKLTGTFQNIDKYKRAETEIERARDQFQSLVNNIPGIVYRCKLDKDWTMLYISDAVEPLCGYPASDFIRNVVRTYESVIHPDDTDYVAQSINTAVAEERSWDIEYRICHKDGDIRWVHEKGRGVPGKDGSVAYLDGFILEITERKQAEEALVESEKRFDLALEGTGAGVWDWDMVKNQVVYSMQWKNMLGYADHEVENSLAGWKNLWHPDDCVRIEQSMEDYLSGKTSRYEIIHRLRHKDGSWRWILTRGAIISDSKGKPYRWVGTNIDITEQKLAEERIRFLSAVTEQISDSLIVTDTHFAITYINRAAEQLFGYTLDEVRGKTPDFLNAEAMADQMQQELYETVSSGKAYAAYSINKRKDGSTFICDYKVMPLKDEQDTIVSYIGIQRDISDRKRLEEEQQRVDKLEAVGLLAGGIAHDFNNILTAILGNISLAGSEAAPGSELQNSLEQAEKAAQRARALTVQLLTFSKGGAPVLKLASLTELLKDTAGFALSGSKVKCRFSIPIGLWHAEIDAGQVSQVIHNLVINAQQAMPAGGSIEISAENMALSEMQSPGRGLPLETGNYIRISVADHGTGIPADHLERIFDPFFTTKQKGNGMGLAVSFSIARQHGGHLSVESEPGSGSTFYLYLPASSQTSAPKVDNKEAIKPAGKARILVMDDEKGVREIAGRLLKHIGYHDIEFAEDGAEAIKLYKAAMKEGKPFSVAILDLTIAGGMGGEVAIKKLLKIDPGVKAIVSSGYIDDPVIAKFRDHGFSGVVAKPYSIAELRKAVQDVIGGA